jgi:hypothetical protein
MRTIAAVSALALVIAAGPAMAQREPAYIDGQGIPNHIPKFATGSRMTDGGGLSGDANGQGIAPFAVTDNLGDGLAINSAVTSGQYNSMRFGHDSSGNAQIAVDSYGGMLSKGMNVVINGTKYPFPGSGLGNMLGPTPDPTSGNLVAWNGGTTTKDTKIGLNSIGGITTSITLNGGDSQRASAHSFIFNDINTTHLFTEGSGSFFIEHLISGPDLDGDRAAANIVLAQTAPIKTNTTIGWNYSGANIYSIMAYNLGGTDWHNENTSVGANFGANIIAQLNADATNYIGNIGLEVDITNAFGSSVWKQIGIYSVKISFVNGVIDDAFAVDGQGTYTWGAGFDFGAASFPYLPTSSLIICTKCGTSTTASFITNGIYIPYVDYTGEALHLGHAVAISGAGNLTLGGTQISMGATGAPLTLNAGTSTAFEIGISTPVTSIINHVGVVASTTGVAPSVGAYGVDTNINLSIGAKGTGSVINVGGLNLNTVTGGGATTRYVCADASGQIVLKSGVCI